MAQLRSPHKTKRVMSAALHLGNASSSSLIPPKIQRHECYSESSDDEDVKHPRAKRKNAKMKERDFIARMEKEAEEKPRKFRTKFRMNKKSFDKLMDIVGKHLVQVHFQNGSS